MSDSVRNSIYEAIASIRLIDPHTHINPHAPASSTLADLLGYHYYTELAHSAGMPKDQIEQDGVSPRNLVQRLVSNLSPLENTAQYRWLVEICRTFFGFDGDRIDQSNWEEVYDSAERQMRLAEWPQMLLNQSNVEAVFLTNDFDDELTGFDTDTYIPCLRTDDLVFHLPKLQTRQRLAACSGVELSGSLLSLRESLKQRFEHFVGSGARACAISLPPAFEPAPVSDGRAATALDEVLSKGSLADKSHQTALSRRTFWTLAELCDEYGLPFDLMIGVNRGVYTDGVYQGQDLYDSRVSLIQYRELFNAFPAVKFPISVLASVTNQELVSYAWIFPNVITNGHWWYSNTPSFIARDAAARLEAVPQTKQIAYYSDAYKLEFVWPKFDMYRQVLAGVLADLFVKDRGWSEERAIELGRQVLRDNVDEIFPKPLTSDSSPPVDPLADTWADEGPAIDSAETVTADSQSPWGDPTVAGTSATLAAGAIGMVEVNEPEQSAAEPSDDADELAAAEDLSGFSTLISEPESSSASTTDDSSADERLDFIDDASGDAANHDTVPIETVLEEPADEETVRIDQMEPEEPHDADKDLPDLPTKLDLNDTVRIEEPATEQAASQLPSDTAYETIIDATDSQGAGAMELDPLPSAEELQAVDVDDVELNESGAERSAPDSGAIEAEAEGESLDVGDLLGDEETAEAAPEGQIRMLRGEESFELGEETLQLQPDPLTGELRMRVPSEDPTEEAEPTIEESSIDDQTMDDGGPDADLVLEIPEDASEVHGQPDETIDLDSDELTAPADQQRAASEESNQPTDEDDDSLNL
jgi:glucuronate isomerase